MLIATLAVTTPFLLAASAPAGMFPEIVIRKAETEHEWAFSIEEGTLTCVQVGADRFVFFGEILTSEEMGEIGNMKLPRSVVVTTNPVALLATIEDKELYAPWDSLETLVKRLAPFEATGMKLCEDQKEL
jgi:hypothetical protein